MSDSSGGGTATRPDMVEAARKFMLTPKVKDSPFEEQRQFLIGKGVTEAEIAEARASIPPEALASSPSNGGVNHSYMAPPPPPQQNRILSLAQSAVLIGSVSYAGYRFMRSFVLPRFFDIPDPATEELRELKSQVNELQNSIKFVMDSVSQTTNALASRDGELQRVEAGISTIKSLLLSHNNFAPIVAPTVSGLPSWQQSLSSAPTVPVNIARSTSPAANQKKEQPTSEGDEDEFVDSIGETVEEERKTPV